MPVRKALPADLAVLSEIENASFASDFLSLRQMRYHLKNPRASFLVFDDNGLAVGYILALKYKYTARIYSLAVSPAQRGRGLGRVLVDAMIKDLQKSRMQQIRLEVDANDARTIALYQSLGFDQTAVLQEYYEDGRNALKMEKPLND